MMFSHRRRFRTRLLRSVFVGAAGVLSLVVLLFSMSHGRRQTVAFAAVATPHLDQPDAICRGCHQQIYDRYQQTPMARGSGLAVDGLDKAELDAKNLKHDSSGVTYRIFVREGQPYLSFSRPAKDPRGPLDGEDRLEYFIGSGHRGRTYLYQQDGLWFETPINWYGKTQQWDMAPAFDNARAMPAPMPVDPNCLHCHTGEVQPTSGAARNRFAGQPFRSGGVGCAACHGDPSAHLANMRVPPQKGGKISALPVAIVNPSSLSPSRRDSVCLQCHLEGDAVVYLPGKSLQTYQPGDDLSASVTYFVDQSRANLGLRASSQYEALLRSACKRSAGDRLTCTTCHDPHSSPAPAERVAFFRSRCLSCHTSGSMVSHHPEQQDCAVCHMPTRKTADISHEQLTDHDIEAAPTRIVQGAEPASKRSPAVLAPVGKSMAGDREFGLAYAQLAERGDRSSGEKALTLLGKAEQSGSKDSEVLDQLGFLSQISGSPRFAAGQYREALRVNPQDVTAAANLAVIDAATGQVSEAIQLLTSVVQKDPSKTSAGLNLAFLKCRLGDKTGAAAVLNTVLELNPDDPDTRRFLGTGFYGNQHCDLR